MFGAWIANKLGKTLRESGITKGEVGMLTKNLFAKPHHSL